MNVVVGDILADRDSRRKGREVKVISVDDEFVTVEVIRNAYSSKVDNVGKSTDVANDRLDRAYTVVRVVEEDEPEDLVTDPGFDEGYTELDGPLEDSEGEDDEPLTEEQESVLEDALASVGYVKLPETQDVVDLIAPMAHENALTYEQTIQLVVDSLRIR